MRTYPIEARHHNANRAAVPLTGEQLREFLAHGFLALRSSLPESYHRVIFERFDELSGTIGHFGNNLLPLIPELNEFFEDPVVRGALTSVLGDAYSMHRTGRCTRIPTRRAGVPQGQLLGLRPPRPQPSAVVGDDHVLPQDTALEKGPDGSDGRQPSTSTNDPRSTATRCPSRVGGIVRADPLRHLAPQDEEPYRGQSVHVQVRVRTLATSWSSDHHPRWRKPRHTPGLDLSPVWRATWNWLNGQPLPGANGRADVQELNSEDESVGINAGYRLGFHDQTPALLGALDSNPTGHENKRRYSDNGQIWREDAVVRNAAHGLVQIGDSALPGLVDVLREGTPRGRKQPRRSRSGRSVPRTPGFLCSTRLPTRTYTSASPRRKRSA